MTRFLTIMSFVLAANSAVYAQPPGEGFSPPGGPTRGGGPPGFHLMTALDSNKDGKLSDSEIRGATAALRKLDADQDGRLSPQEIGWPPPFRGFPGFGGGPPGFGGGPGNQQPRRPNPEAAPSGRSARATADASRSRPSFFTAHQLQRLDRNSDGRITVDEIPKQMRELILQRVDRDRNGFLDKRELQQLDTGGNQPK